MRVGQARLGKVLLAAAAATSPSRDLLMCAHPPEALAPDQLAPPAASAASESASQTSTVADAASTTTVSAVAAGSASANERTSAQWPVPLVTHDCPRADSGEGGARDGHGVGPGRVLLIYTGGTMGMAVQNGSLTPLKGYLPECIAAMPEMYEASMPDLDILEYDPLIDSSNIGPEDWASLASAIRDHYYDYDGFVIVHGTDTMAYTASALSFMLEGLGKAVVLTGSMIPLCEVYNDARRNLLISTLFAAQLELCEVAIFFNDRVRQPLQLDRPLQLERPLQPLAGRLAPPAASRASCLANPESRCRWIHTLARSCSAAIAPSRSIPTRSPPSTRPTSRRSRRSARAWSRIARPGARRPPRAFVCTRR